MMLMGFARMLSQKPTIGEAHVRCIYVRNTGKCLEGIKSWYWGRCWEMRIIDERWHSQRGSHCQSRATTISCQMRR